MVFAATMVGSSKAERDFARRVAIHHLINNPKEKIANVRKRKYNYNKNKDEYVLAGTVFRKGDGFLWSPWDDNSSTCYVNRNGESLDPIWWVQIYETPGKKVLASVKTVKEAREMARNMILSGKYRNLYVCKAGWEYLGIVSMRKDRPGSFVWITLKNPMTASQIDKTYVLNKDGSTGTRIRTP